MLSYILWNANPEIFSIGSFSLRWYGLFFALGFLISQQVLYYIYRKEGKPEKDIDTLTIYMVLATIIGARLGHIFFYQPELLWENPLGVFLPFEFTPEFRFTGLQGLASHGAAIGILFALWLYSRKKKPGQNYLQVLDRIVIVVALTGCLIRLGNFFNSEIIGIPTNSSLGVVFVGRVEEALKRNDMGENPVESITIVKNQDLPKGMHGRVPISIYLFFKKGTDQEKARIFCTTNTKYYLTKLYEFVDEPPPHGIAIRTVPGESRHTGGQSKYFWHCPPPRPALRVHLKFVVVCLFVLGMEPGKGKDCHRKNIWAFYGHFMVAAVWLRIPQRKPGFL